MVRIKDFTTLNAIYIKLFKKEPIIIVDINSQNKLIVLILLGLSFEE